MERNNLKWFTKKLKVIFKYIIAFELYCISEKNQVDHVKNSSANKMRKIKP